VRDLYIWQAASVQCRDDQLTRRRGQLLGEQFAAQASACVLRIGMRGRLDHRARARGGMAERSFADFND
jgi:hypothetical protein